jgi:protein TonB
MGPKADAALARLRRPPSWRARAVLGSLALHVVLLGAGALLIHIEGRPRPVDFVATAAIDIPTDLDSTPPVPEEPFELPSRPDEDAPPLDEEPPVDWDLPEPDDVPRDPSTIVVRTPFASSSRYRPARRRPAPPPVAQPPRAPPPVLSPPAARPPPAPPPPRVENTEAALVRYAPPPYPESARSRGVEGSVAIEVTVLADGTVSDVRVVRSSGAAVLDRAAVRAVRGWAFRPATVNGEPVESVLRLPPIRFRLTD